MRRSIAIAAGALSLITAYLAPPVMTSASAQNAPQDNIIEGTLYPKGYTPVEIKNGVYPRVYTPNTEKLGPKEMRVTALGTGMPNVITGSQKASGWYVELGNGETFLFDLGSGTMESLAKLHGESEAKSDGRVDSFSHHFEGGLDT